MGAGCGLPGIVLAAIGARAIITDMECNLPLLKTNVVANQVVCDAVRTGRAPTTSDADTVDGGGKHRDAKAGSGSVAGDNSTVAGCGSVGVGTGELTAGSVQVLACRWGEPLPPELQAAPVDLVVATDVLYSYDAVPALVATLAELTAATAAGGHCTEVLLAAGRNRHAADAFFGAVAALFDVESLKWETLDPVYRCDDVGVWRLVRRLATL